MMLIWQHLRTLVFWIMSCYLICAILRRHGTDRALGYADNMVCVLQQCSEHIGFVSCDLGHKSDAVINPYPIHKHVKSSFDFGYSSADFIVYVST